MTITLTNGNDRFPRFLFDSNLGNDEVFARAGHDTLDGGFRKLWRG